MHPSGIESNPTPTALAAIDIGTNSVHMVVARVASPERFEVLTRHKEMARLAKSNRGNALMIHGDAQQFFQEHLLSESLDAVHVYFPDPWWKKRHRKRRIMNEAFLLSVYRTLKPNGRLHFWTDVKEYFDVSLELIQEKIPLSGPEHVDESPSVHDLDYRTHFERRMRLHDKPVYRSQFVKNTASGGEISENEKG